METDRFCGDHVHERPALDSGKNSRVNLLCELLLTHNDATARAAQTFVCRRGDKLRVGNRTRMLTACNQPGDVRHVDEQDGAD